MTAPTRHDATIEGLFCGGHTFDGIVSTGEANGWARDDVLAVLKDRGWDLDASGRLPRSKRVTSPLGLRNLQPAAPPARPRLIAPAAAPRKPSAPAAPRPAGSRRKPIEHGKPNGYFAHYRHKDPIPDDDSCGCRAAGRAYFRDQTAKKAKKGSAEPSSEPADAAPDPTPATGLPLPRQPERLAVAVELDAWFAEAQRSPSRPVQRACRVAVSALLQLRIAMDDLARAERAAAYSPIVGAE